MKKGGLHCLLLSCFGIWSPHLSFPNSAAGLISFQSALPQYNLGTQLGRREASPTFKDFYSERLDSTMIYSILLGIQKISQQVTYR